MKMIKALCQKCAGKLGLYKAIFAHCQDHLNMLQHNGYFRHGMQPNLNPPIQQLRTCRRLC